MTFEEMQTAWHAGNSRLVEYKMLNESLVKDLISHKSNSILSLIKGRYRSAMLLIAFYLIVFSLVIIGDPFDFQVNPYISLSLLFLFALLFWIMAIRAYRQINHIETNHHSLVQSLEQLTSQYNKFREWLLSAFLVTGSIINASFLPRMEDRKGLMIAIAWGAFIMAADLFLFWLFVKADVFQGRRKDQLKNRMEDLKLQLKELTAFKEA